MSKLRFPVALAALVALAGLNPAFAQQNPNADRELITQESQNQRQNQNQRRQNSAEGLTVKDVIIKKLRSANEGEIELAQMAQQKIQNQDLQQFAEMLIQDHQALNQKLEQVSQGGGQPDRVQGGDRAEQRQPAQQAQPRQQQAQGENNQPGQQRRLGQERQGRQEQVPAVLCDIMDQAQENALKMKKQMLQEHEGQDFQMAFLGQQIMTHTMSLAELKAIESSGELQDLQPIIKEAATKVESHLSKAKQLADKFEKDRSSGNAASNPAQPNRR